MFHKTSLRLTSVYLAIIMAISLFFSITLYNLSMREVTRGFQRQNEVINSLPPVDFLPNSFQRAILESRQASLREARNRIISQLAFVNLMILALGGGLSYFLARRTLEPIEAAHNSLEQFTADASHELRTPIAAMKSEIEVALLEPKLKVGHAKEVLQSSLEELDRLTALTSGLLSLARQQDAELHIETHKVRPIITAATKKLAVQAADKQINVQANVPNPDQTVKADADSLLQILVILLDNAIKYSSLKSSVTIQAHADKDKTNISIIDHGPGIPEADLPHIFKRFYRADSSRSSQDVKGHGLGLAIAEQLITRQNGSIEIVSQPNKSTTATITLPTN